MEKHKKITVPTINVLSEVFMETLKEISKSGTKLNIETFSILLAKKHIIKDMLRLAKSAQKEKKTRIDTELQMLKSELDTSEKNKKRILKDIFDLEGKLDREKDFNKRRALIFLNLSRIPGNETFYELLDEYKQLVIDEADSDKFENILTQIKDKLLNEDIKIKKIHHFEEEEEIDDLQPTSSIFRRFIGDPDVIKLKLLKKEGLKVLADLKSALGEEYSENIETIENRIIECDNIDYFLSQRKHIIEVINDYIRRFELDRDQITSFITEIGKQLIDMEGRILVAFSSSGKSLKEDYSFNEDLENRIQIIGESVERSKNFKLLKTLIISELSKITKTLDEKQREYIFRMEKASKEKEKLQHNFDNMINNVIEQNKELIKKNQKDALTGIFNRSTFDDFFNIELQRYHRYNEPFSLMLFDIDHFKSVNDTYGHNAGDKVLKGIAICIENILRKPDVFARYGGEEFILLMPNTDLKNGQIAAQKLCDVVRETEFTYERQKVLITVSVGITEVNSGDLDITTIFNRADANMYKAKEEGRNRVVSDSGVD